MESLDRFNIEMDFIFSFFCSSSCVLGLIDKPTPIAKLIAQVERKGGAFHLGGKPRAEIVWNVVVEKDKERF